MIIWTCSEMNPNVVKHKTLAIDPNQSNRFNQLEHDLLHLNLLTSHYAKIMSMNLVRGNNNIAYIYLIMRNITVLPM